MTEFDRGFGSFLTGHVSSFIITDDLQILTNTPGSYLHVLEVNGIHDDRASLEERTLTFSSNQATRLVEIFLVSKTPLTDVFRLGSSAGNATLDESVMVTHDSLLPKTHELRPTDCCPMNVKALVQKSTRRVLLVQSREDFADFILSFTLLPLRTIEMLFDGKACLGSVDNLCRSIMKLCGEPFVICFDTNNTSPEPFFPLNQPGTPSFYPVNATENRDQRRCVKGPALFTVSDDLVVSTPPASTISILDQMKIPPSDVEELDINVGVREALSILKASLTSTSALTDGLKPFLMTDPEQEEWCTF
ncbi:uncharacterized protein [Henckelia pumila]|uniref:uncharacterized protein n=1 Tax=Henckelia pumila TaxID=405737 RepID=UPI003C6DE67E